MLFTQKCVSPGCIERYLAPIHSLEIRKPEILFQNFFRRCVRKLPRSVIRDAPAPEGAVASVSERSPARKRWVCRKKEREPGRGDTPSNFRDGKLSKSRPEITTICHSRCPSAGRRGSER